MAIFLGIDTGGTYTDAVIHDESKPPPGIVAKAKALTTKEDLSIGIGGAIDAALGHGYPTSDIALVSISTTLATNALVEGQGGRICLVLIGFDEKALERAGLGEALGTDPVLFIAGGHSPGGARQAPLDRVSLDEGIERHVSNVDAFAVVAYFGTRDPEDEVAARNRIASLTGLPVTCGHELASSLNGPKRALTAVLNARLIGMISDLIDATEKILAERGINAPLMLVRGDGSLVSAAFSRTRPIETILSGPAASLVGAAHLTGAPDAVVSDIGGTTTDIAILRNGRPALSPDGAQVGGHHTMVEAVDMVTHGLGGDSEIRIDDSGLTARLVLGPRKIMPIALLATRFPDCVHAMLDIQLAQTAPDPSDARFVLRAGGVRSMAGLSDQDLELLDRITDAPKPENAVLKSRMHTAGLRRLVSRGLVTLAGFCPTDAAHILGHHTAWDCEAARKAGQLMARKRDGTGRAIATCPVVFSRLVEAALVRKSAEILLDASLIHDGLDKARANSQTLLAQTALDGHSGATRLSIGLDLPLVGLGASAPLYYPGIAALLKTRSLVPEHADVANAVGAVVGQIRITMSAEITQPAEGRFRVHLPDGTVDFPNDTAAQQHALSALRDHARAAATEAGAGEIELVEDWQANTVTIEGREMFVSGAASVIASGRPRLV